MSILDGNLFFEPLAGTAITATAASTNVIDLGNISGALAQGRDMGIGDNPALKLAIYVTQAFTAGGAAALNIQFQGAPDNGSGSPGSYTTYAESGPLTVSAPAQLALGYKLFPIDVPHRTPDVAPPRFYRLNYVVTTGPMTAGKIFAALVLDRQDNTIYNPGIAIAN